MGNYAVIMAGGKGERFWPWSRNDFPKQFLNLIGERSLISRHLIALMDFFPRKRFWSLRERLSFRLYKSTFLNCPETILLLNRWAATLHHA